MKTTSVVIACALAAATATGLAATGPSAKETSYTKTLKSVPAAELPAKAAQVVKHTSARQLEATTIAVVKAAVAVNPAATPMVVGAIAKEQPEVAHVAAGTAAALQPKQAAAITQAATAAAPSRVNKIVQAVCREVPSEYRSVAAAASQAAPSANKEILNAVAAALPTMKPSIERAMAVYTGTASVVTVLDQATTPASTTPTLASIPRPPTVTPPYVPLTTVTNVNPGGSGTVPTGGRDYAAP